MFYRMSHEDHEINIQHQGAKDSVCEEKLGSAGRNDLEAENNQDKDNLAEGKKEITEEICQNPQEEEIPASRSKYSKRIKRKTYAFAFVNCHTCNRRDSNDNLLRCANELCGLHFCLPCLKEYIVRVYIYIIRGIYANGG